MLTIDDFETGERVAVRPHRDEWVQGDRYGVVAKVGNFYVHVRLGSGRVRRFSPDSLSKVVPLPRVLESP